MLKKVRALMSLLVLMSVPSIAFAQDGGSDKGYIGLAAGIAIGLAAFGGAMGQGRTAHGALEGMARNPSAAGSLFTPMIIGLVLIESLVIYALVVAILLLGKI